MIYLASSILSSILSCIAFSSYAAGGLNGLMAIYFLIFILYVFPLNTLLIFIFGNFTKKLMLFLDYLFV